MASIIPSILVYSQDEFLSQIHTISKVCDFVQIDVADGIFVEGKTWYDPAFVAKHMPLDFELHLMVNNPLIKIKDWVKQRHLKRIIFHAESVLNVPAAIKKLRAYKKEICLCLNPETSLAVVDHVANKIDAVQLMSVIPGKQGQPFIPETIDRARAIHVAYPSLPIASDGAVNGDTIPPLFDAGVNRFAPGSAIWEKGDPIKNYQKLSTLIHTLTYNT